MVKCLFFQRPFKKSGQRVTVNLKALHRGARCGLADHFVLVATASTEAGAKVTRVYVGMTHEGLDNKSTNKLRGGKKKLKVVRIVLPL